MMRMGAIAVGFLAASICSAAADPLYHPFETRGPLIKEGQGGERTTVDGIDIWAHGDPPRRYQILGAITDERANEDALFRKIISRLPSDIAKATKAAGGDAAILDSEDNSVSSTFSRTTEEGRMQTFANETHRSRYLVVKYLPEEPAKALQ